MALGGQRLPSPEADRLRRGVGQRPKPERQDGAVMAKATLNLRARGAKLSSEPRMCVVSRPCR